MIEVKVPMEIEDYKGKIIAGLSLRQLIFGGIAIGCGTPVFFLLKDFNQDIALYAAMLTALPSGLMGFVKKDGHTFDELIKIYLYAFTRPSKRTYCPEEDVSEVPVEILKYRGIKTEKTSEGEEKQNVKREKTTAKRTKIKARSEFSLVKVTEKGSERKRKAVYKAIKAKRRSLKKAKRKKEKEAEKRSSTTFGAEHAEL